MTESSLRKKTIIGSVWSFISQFGRQILSLIITIFLARLLSPEEFGLIALVSSILSFALIFTELGYGSALIHKKEVSELDLSSVFWVNIIIGTLLTILFLFLADPLVIFFDNNIKEIIICLSFNFIISSFSIVQRIILVKEMNFKLLARIEILGVLFSGLLAVLMAFFGFGIYSLIAQILSTSLINNILLWKYSSWQPKFIFNLNSIKSLNKFSINYFLNQTFGYWTKNFDNLLIGKYLGEYSLGIYSKSYNLLSFRINSISKIISRVLFPSLSKIQDDNEQIKNFYLKSITAICVVIFPLIIALFITADKIILILYGPKWIEMIPIFKILSILGFSLAIGSVHSNIYLAKGRTDLQLKLGLIFKPIILFSIYIGLNWGIEGVAYFVGITSLVSQFPQIHIAGRLIDLSLKDVLLSIYKIFIISVLTGIIIFGVDFFFKISNIYISLIFQFLFAISFYVAMLYMFEKKIILTMISIIKK